MISGLEAVGETAAARRAALTRLSDDALAEQLVWLARGLAPYDGVAIAEEAGLPLGEVLASPFALRAVAMGIEVGATTRHLELTGRLDWTDAYAPAEVRDSDHGVWVQGSLRTGKYQGFLAEAPFATFDPSHVSKWGPHELMHRAAGFFYRRDLTAWELYLGARLDELVPVVLFYGPEQAMRLDEGAFDRAAAGAAKEARVEDARWRLESGSTLLARARRAAPILREGVAHFERELRAIDEELRTGHRVRAPHPFLDASSDATAYVVGHLERLRAGPVGDVLEAVPDAVRAGTVELFRERVELLFDRLLFAPLEGRASSARRATREAWDLLLRAAHAGLEVEAHCDSIAGGADVRLALAGELVDEEAALVLLNGAFEAHAIEPIADGLSQVAPCALALYERSDTVEAFAASSALLARAPLAERFRRWLGAEGADPAVREMARFEEALVLARRDDAIERLCVPAEALPDDDEALARGVVVAHVHRDRLSMTHEVLTSHAAFAEGERLVPLERPTELVVLAHHDEVAVVPLLPEVARALDALEGTVSVEALAHGIDLAYLPQEVPQEVPQEGFPEDGLAWVRELLGAGALGWRPR